MDTQSFDFLQIAVGLTAVGSGLAAIAALPVSRRHAVWLILVAVAALAAFFSLAGPSLTAAMFHIRSLWPQLALVIIVPFAIGLWAHQLSKVLVVMIIIAFAAALIGLVAVVFARDRQMIPLEAATTIYMAQVRPLLMRLLATRLELLVGLVGLAAGILADHLLLRLDGCPADSKE